MKRASIFESFRVAGWGVLHTLATQRHMKIHTCAGVMVMLVGMALPLGLGPKIALLFSVALVFFAEILNTALEHFVDIHIREFHRGAMLAKDAAAAGVLVLSVFTVIVLADILWVERALVQRSGPVIARSLIFGLPLTFTVAALLWGPTQWWVRAPLALGAAVFALPLWLESVDPIFSVVLGGLILMAAVARPRPNPSDGALSPELPDSSGAE